MKYLLAFAITLFTLVSFSQKYVQVKENEPFRRADMIIVECDSLPSNAFQIIGSTLVKYNFTIKEAFKEFGSITTNFRSNKLVQVELQITIVGHEIRVQGGYNSIFPLGSQNIFGAGTSSASSGTKSVLLDYRNDLEAYYDEMTEIATVIKEKVVGKRLLHVERAMTTKY